MTNSHITIIQINNALWDWSKKPLFLSFHVHPTF